MKQMVALVAAVAVSLLLPGPTASGSVAAPMASPSGAVATSSGGGDVRAADIPTSPTELAKTLLDSIWDSASGAAYDGAEGWVLSLIGVHSADKTQEQLDEIQKSLTEINGKLDLLESGLNSLAAEVKSLQSDVKQSEFAVLSGQAADDIGKIDAITTRYQSLLKKPLTDPSRDNSAAELRKDILTDLRNVPAILNRKLTGQATSDGLLVAASQAVASQDRFFSPEDSRRVRQVYQYYATYQALATNYVVEAYHNVNTTAQSKSPPQDITYSEQDVKDFIDNTRTNITTQATPQYLKPQVPNRTTIDTYTGAMWTTGPLGKDATWNTTVEYQDPDKASVKEPWTIPHNGDRNLIWLPTRYVRHVAGQDLTMSDFTYPEPSPYDPPGSPAGPIKWKFATSDDLKRVASNSIGQPVAEQGSLGAYLNKQAGMDTQQFLGPIWSVKPIDTTPYQDRTEEDSWDTPMPDVWTNYSYAAEKGGSGMYIKSDKCLAEGKFPANGLFNTRADLPNVSADDLTECFRGYSLVWSDWKGGWTESPGVRDIGATTNWDTWRKDPAVIDRVIPPTDAIVCKREGISPGGGEYRLSPGFWSTKNPYEGGFWPDTTYFGRIYYADSKAGGGSGQVIRGSDILKYDDYDKHSDFGRCNNGKYNGAMAHAIPVRPNPDEGPYFFGSRTSCSNTKTQSAGVQSAAAVIDRRCALLSELGVPEKPLTANKNGWSRVGKVKCPDVCGKVKVKAALAGGGKNVRKRETVGRGRAIGKRSTTAPLMLHLSKGFTNRLASKQHRSMPIKVSIVHRGIHAWRVLPITMARR